MAIQNLLEQVRKIISRKPKGEGKLDFKNNPKESVAYLISRVFGPAPMLFLLWLITAFKSGIGFGKALWVYPIIFAVSFCLPFLLSSYLIRIKKIKDIEWSDINDRKKYMFPLSIYSVTTLLVLTRLLTNNTIFNLSLLLSAIFLSMVACYKFFDFKISGHVTIATIAIAAINLFFGLNFLWLFLVLVPIMWARSVLKVHTFSQLIAGFILPALVIIFAILLFGWPNIP